MRVINIAEQAGRYVSSRDTARRIRESVVGPVCIDFTGVEVVSNSFAHELLGVLVGQRGEEWFASNVEVTGLSDCNREIVLRAISLELEARSGVCKNRNGEKQMSEYKYTPGPWRLDTWNGYLLSEEDVGIVKFDMNRTLLADAQLIAAAPELLAALELALKDMIRWGIFGPGRSAVEAAIKKAKGE